MADQKQYPFPISILGPIVQGWYDIWVMKQRQKIREAKANLDPELLIGETQDHFTAQHERATDATERSGTHIGKAKLRLSDAQAQVKKMTARRDALRREIEGMPEGNEKELKKREYINILQAIPRAQEHERQTLEHLQTMTSNREAFIFAQKSKAMQEQEVLDQMGMDADSIAFARERKESAREALEAWGYLKSADDAADYSGVLHERATTTEEEAVSLEMLMKQMSDVYAQEKQVDTTGSSFSDEDRKALEKAAGGSLPDWMQQADSSDSTSAQ